MGKLELSAIFSRYEGTRSDLVPILQDTQSLLGYLPVESLNEISSFLSVPLNQIYGVATFYSQFYFTRQGKNQIKVCCGTACHVKGAPRLIESFEQQLGIKCGTTSDEYEHSLQKVACFGCCSLAPVAMINEEIFARLTPEKVGRLIAEKIRGEAKESTAGGERHAHV
ncbi:MAG: NAD(P)H-dependent oxidoreductase subunit E [Firmicutes bacterium]|nr:NAD(P)H-dependent oxidoreductase subunit E [Dethiobacter sp.]MBS3889434.1 NAD(P)H-dependent oxidoreductase subunit E [Bacillota bacterium]